MKNDMYDNSLHHLVYQMMNSWLVLLAYIFFSLCALSFRLPCFSSSNFWKFIFHKVVQRHVLGVLKSLMSALSQIFQRVCHEGIMKIRWKLTELSIWAGVLLFWNTVYIGADAVGGMGNGYCSKLPKVKSFWGRRPYRSLVSDEERTSLLSLVIAVQPWCK